MGYLFLIITIIFESTSVICMKMSAGFTNTVYTIAAVVTYAVGFWFLTLALEHLKAGIANAIWGGASTILVAVLGMLIFKEKINLVQAMSLLLIVIGIVGLHLAETKV